MLKMLLVKLNAKCAVTPSSNTEATRICSELDCKTVRIFAYSSTREQSHKRSGMRLKTESGTGERR